MEALSDDELESRLYPPSPMAGKTDRPVPDWAAIHAERKRPGVTLELLHLEYLQREPDGYRYSWFCHEYQDWLKQRGATMREVHRAGEKTFVDYAGKKPCIWSPSTGERIEVELFVAVLGASTTPTPKQPEPSVGQIGSPATCELSTTSAGVTEAETPDQLRSGVSAPCRYEPRIQRSYEEMAGHCNTTVLPARPGHPRDKAKVEVAVQIAERWILARLRNEVLHSMDTLNARIAELLDELNVRQMRVYKSSRRELFERLDRPALRPLPTERFIYGEWKKANVNVDYHIEIEGHDYSVPHALIHQSVEARTTAATVEIYRNNARVASHRRSFNRGKHTTIADHMPPSHQKHAEWTPSRMIGWTAKTGPETKRLVEAILGGRQHPEQGYRSCLGILRLGRVYSEPRLEAACARAMAVGARSIPPCWSRSCATASTVHQRSAERLTGRRRRLGFIHRHPGLAGGDSGLDLGQPLATVQLRLRSAKRPRPASPVDIVEVGVHPRVVAAAPDDLPGPCTDLRRFGVP